MLGGAITFADACALVVDLEGKYSNDPHDPGGETKFGIARHAHPEITDEHWAAYTLADAQHLYQAKYWDPYRCGEMPRCWALPIFDGEVNQGGAMITLAQLALGLRSDGNVGALTLAAMWRVNDREPLALYMAARALRYMQLPLFARDGKGWLKRLFVIQGLAYSTGSAIPASRIVAQ